MIEECALTGSPATEIARRAIPALARYREPCHSRSIFEIAVTLVPFVALWAVAWAAVHFGYWELSFLAGVPAAGLLVRLFMIQHDYGHVTPYDDWRRAHANYHVNSGHLDRRGVAT